MPASRTVLAVDDLDGLGGRGALLRQFVGSSSGSFPDVSSRLGGRVSLGREDTEVRCRFRRATSRERAPSPGFTLQTPPLAAQPRGLRGPCRRPRPPFPCCCFLLRSGLFARVTAQTSCERCLQSAVEESRDGEVSRGHRLVANQGTPVPGVQVCPAGSRGSANGGGGRALSPVPQGAW